MFVLIIVICGYHGKVWDFLVVYASYNIGKASTVLEPSSTSVLRTRRDALWDSTEIVSFPVNHKLSIVCCHPNFQCTKHADIFNNIMALVNVCYNLCCPWSH